MKRRSFLRLAGLGTAVVALPGFAFFYASPEKSAVQLIMNKFHFLKIDRKEVELYVSDYFKKHPVNESIPWKMKIKMHRYLDFETIRSQNLLNGFLPSTDFFFNKMDESKEVKYVALYNAHQRPCANPFSSMYYPPQQAPLS